MGEELGLFKNAVRPCRAFAYLFRSTAAGSAAGVAPAGNLVHAGVVIDHDPLEQRTARHWAARSQELAVIGAALAPQYGKVRPLCELARIVIPHGKGAESRAVSSRRSVSRIDGLTRAKALEGGERPGGRERIRSRTSSRDAKLVVEVRQVRHVHAQVIPALEHDLTERRTLRQLLHRLSVDLPFPLVLPPPVEDQAQPPALLSQ